MSVQDENAAEARCLQLAERLETHTLLPTGAMERRNRPQTVTCELAHRKKHYVRQNRHQGTVRANRLNPRLSSTVRCNRLYLQLCTLHHFALQGQHPCPEGPPGGRFLAHTKVHLPSLVVKGSTLTQGLCFAIWLKPLRNPRGWLSGITGTKPHSLRTLNLQNPPHLCPQTLLALRTCVVSKRPVERCSSQGNRAHFHILADCWRGFGNLLVGCTLCGKLDAAMRLDLAEAIHKRCSDKHNHRSVWRTGGGTSAAEGTFTVVLACGP
eukprot:6475486-Amphidinium_carterae.1